MITEENSSLRYTSIKERKELTVMAAININKEHFDNLLLGNKPVLVDFWAPWCSYCRRIGPAYDALAEKYGERVEIVKLNIDEEPAFAQAEGIEVIPTLILYKEGKAVDSIVAPESKARIESFLNEALAK